MMNMLVSCKKICCACLLLFLLLYSHNGYTQKLEDNTNQYINRALELMDKTRTPQEENELTNLIQTAKSIPEDKQNARTKELITSYDKKNIQRFKQLLENDPWPETMAELRQLKGKLNVSSGKELNDLLERYYTKEDLYEATRIKELQTKNVLDAEEAQELNSLLLKKDQDISDLENKREQLISTIKSSDTSAAQKNALNQELLKTNQQIADRQAASAFSLCTGNCDPRCFYKEMQTCSFCPLFAVVFNTASSIAQHAINTFSGSIIKVVIIAFGIWIAFQVLAFVATVEVRDLKDLLSSLITQSFIVMLVVIILQNGAMDFFNYALEPIYTTGQKLAQEIIQPNAVAKGNVSIKALKDEQKVPDSVLKGCSSTTGISDDKKGEGALPKSMGDSIICTMTLIQNRVAKVKALGSASLCQSWKERFIIVPHLNYMFVGIGLWIGAMFLLLAVPFMMVDAIFEMAVAAALLPFGIGAYAFKVTRGYTKKIWETFLNSMFQFVFVSLIALMIVVAYQSIITNSIGDFDAMFESGQKAVLSDILVKLPWFSTAFLELCFVMILAWSVLGSAKSFAGEFAGSISSTSIGSSIGTMAGSFSKSAALKIKKSVADPIGEHIGHGIKAVAIAPVHYARRAAMNRRASRIKKNGYYDEKTRQYVLESKGGKKKLTLVENADGTKTVRKEKLKNGQVVKSKTQNSHFTIRTVRHEKNGKVWYEDKVKLNSSFASELYKKDGSLNENDFENLMIQQGFADADRINIALAKEAMAQRMPNGKHNFRDHDYVSQEAIYEDGKFVGYIETHADGSKSEVRFKIGEPGKKGRKRMMTTFTHVDAKGRGTTLQSDGIINKKQTFKTKDGTVNGEVDERSKKDYYRLGAYYDDWFNHQGKNRVNKAMQESMFSAEEVKDAHYRIFSTSNTSAQANLYEFEVYHA